MTCNRLPAGRSEAEKGGRGSSFPGTPGTVACGLREDEQCRAAAGQEGHCQQAGGHQGEVQGGAKRGGPANIPRIVHHQPQQVPSGLKFLDVIDRAEHTYEAASLQVPQFKQLARLQNMFDTSWNLKSPFGDQTCLGHNWVEVSSRAVQTQRSSFAMRVQQGYNLVAGGQARA